LPRRSSIGGISRLSVSNHAMYRLAEQRPFLGIGSSSSAVAATAIVVVVIIVVVTDRQTDRQTDSACEHSFSTKYNTEQF